MKFRHARIRRFEELEPRRLMVVNWTGGGANSSFWTALNWDANPFQQEVVFNATGVTMTTPDGGGGGVTDPAVQRLVVDGGDLTLDLVGNAFFTNSIPPLSAETRVGGSESAELTITTSVPDENPLYQTGYVRIGEDADGALQVKENVHFVGVYVLVGQGSGRTGAMSVEDSARVEISDSVTVGQSHSTGTLTVDSGSMDVATSGSGSLNIGLATTGGAGSGSGTLAVNSGGTLRGGAATVGSLHAAGTATVDGGIWSVRNNSNAELRDDYLAISPWSLLFPITLSVPSGLTLNDLLIGTIGTGSVTVENSGFLEADDIKIGTNQNANGSLTIANSGKVFATGDLNMKTGAGESGRAKLTLTDAALLVVQDFEFAPSVTFAGGEVVSRVSITNSYVSTRDVIIGNSGTQKHFVTMFGSTSVWFGRGVTINPSGNLSLLDGVFYRSGKLTNTGTLVEKGGKFAGLGQELENAGKLVIGASAETEVALLKNGGDFYLGAPSGDYEDAGYGAGQIETVEVTGAFEQVTGGTLRVETGAVTSGVGAADKLELTENVTLGGSLVVTALTAPGVYTTGDTFLILSTPQSKAMTGTFTNFDDAIWHTASGVSTIVTNDADLPTLAAGLAWQITIGATEGNDKTVRLTVINVVSDFSAVSLTASGTTLSLTYKVDGDYDAPTQGFYISIFDSSDGVTPRTWIASQWIAVGSDTTAGNHTKNFTASIPQIDGDHYLMAVVDSGRDASGAAAIKQAEVSEANNFAVLADAAFLNSDGQVIYHGREASDTITVDLTGGGTQLRVSANTTSTFTLASVTGVRVYSHGSASNTVTVSNSITLPTWLFGGLGADTLYGGSGDDTFYGGGGNDILAGFAGNNTYRYHGAANGLDEIFAELGAGSPFYLDKFKLDNAATIASFNLYINSLQLTATASGQQTLEISRDTGLKLKLTDGEGAPEFEIESVSGLSTFNSTWQPPYTTVATLEVDAGAKAIATSDLGPNVAVLVTGGQINFAATQHLAALNIDSGSAALTAGGGKVLTVGSLDINLTNTAQLDLTDNDLIVLGGSHAAVTALIASGFNGGAWNGDGIISSTAAIDPLGITGLGILDNNDGAGNPVFFGEVHEALAECADARRGTHNASADNFTLAA